MTTIPNCCCARMLRDPDWDEVYCPKCGRKLSHEQLLRASRKTPTVSAEELERLRVAAERVSNSRVDPGAFYDAISKETDARIAELHARAVKYLAEPCTFVQTPAGNIGLRADPSMSPLEMRIMHGPQRPMYEVCECFAAHVCDEHRAAAPTIETPWMRADGPPPDPIEVKYDGVTLCLLIARAHCNSHESVRPRFNFTPMQRAAVSAHWSAELRAKVAASKDRERRRVVVDLEEP